MRIKYRRPTESERLAQLQGRKAYRDKRSLSDCPYMERKQKAEAVAWRTGFVREKLGNKRRSMLVVAELGNDA